MTQRKTKRVTLPPRLLTQIEQAAQVQGRPVNDVLAEAVDRYLQEERWASLMSYGRQRARELGLIESDAEVRSIPAQ